MKLLRRGSPCLEESMLGYIYRLADENKCAVEWLINELRMKKLYMSNEINYLKNDTDIELLSDACKVDKSVLKGLTLYRYYSYFEEHCNFELFCSEHATNRYTKFCPLCLKEERYHRLYWILNKIRVCLIHNVILKEVCPICGELLNIENIMIDRCTFGHKISKSEPVYCIDQLIIKNQQSIYNIYGVLPENVSLQDYNFFMGMSKNSYYRLIRVFYDIINTNFHSIDLLKREQQVLEEYDHKLYSLMLIEKVIQDWPYSIYLLLDDLNNAFEVELEDCIKKEQIVSIFLLRDMIRIFNELEYLFLKDSSNKFICDAILDYMIKKYSISFINKRYSILIEDSRYVSLEIAKIIFYIDEKSIKLMFRTMNIKGLTCVKINNIISFITALLTTACVRVQNHSDDYINVVDVCNNYKLLPKQLLSIIKRKKIFTYVRLDNYIGLDNIYLKKGDLLNFR